MPQPSVNWAPVISDGTIYVGDTQGNLYAIGEARR
jgi:outer membrane protein assembly factor BamB